MAATSLNLCVPRILLCSCVGGKSTTVKRRKVLRIVRMDDGEVLEFRAPVIVKDILVNSPGSGIVESRNGTEDLLPPEYQLEIGKVYYILPPAEKVRGGEEDDVGVKRVKVVITKQQLKELLLMKQKKISVEEVLWIIERKSTSWCSVDLLSTTNNWKPKLESIPEGSDCEL